MDFCKERWLVFDIINVPLGRCGDEPSIIIVNTDKQ